MKIINGNIPTIDISNEEDHQFIVDKESGRYLGHVSTVLVSNQTIIASYVLGHGRGQAILKKSKDGGLTWSERLDVPDSWSTLLQVPVIYRINDGKMNRLLLFTGHYPIRVSISENEGETWTELKPIGDFGGNVAMSDLLRLNNGCYIGFFHDDGRFMNKGKKDIRYQLYQSHSINKVKVELYTSFRNSDDEWSNPELDQRTSLKIQNSESFSQPKLIYESYSGKKNKEDISKIYKTMSCDGGKTWSIPKEIVWKKDAYLAEAAAIYSPNRNQIALLLRENTRKYNSFISVSNDEGETWSKPIQAAKELTGDRHQIRYSHDGRLVITFRDTCLSSPTHGDWVIWVGTYEDLINGNKGQYRIKLMKNYYKDDCGYAGLELLNDGTFVATSYGHWIKNEEPYIICVRFKLEEMDDFLKQQNK